MERLERREAALFMDAGGGRYVPLGEGLGELSPGAGARVEKVRDLLGQTRVYITGYDREIGLRTFYARKGEPLFQRLKDIIDNALVLSRLRTSVVMAWLYDGSAVREEAFIELVDWGGDTSGCGIGFRLHLTGRREQGSFCVSSGVFTPKGRR